MTEMKLGYHGPEQIEDGEVDLQATRVWSLFSNMDLNDPASSST